MRISLRELLIVVAIAAVGMAALKYADSVMLTVLQALSGVLLLVLMVRAIVDRGRGQAFAIGFVVCSLAYILALIAAMTDRTGISTFGTLTALRELHDVVLIDRWYNEATNQVAEGFKPTGLEQTTDRTTRIELQKWSPPVEVASDQEIVVDPTKSGIAPAQSTTTTEFSERRGAAPSATEQRGSVTSIDPQPANRPLDPNTVTPPESQQITTREDVANSAGRRGRGMDSEILQMLGGGGGQRGPSTGVDPELFGGGGGGGRRGNTLTGGQFSQQGGGGRGGGRRGGRGGALSLLSPQQTNEYAALTPADRTRVSNMLTTTEGLAAVQTGRPLSTINLVNYVRRITPSYERFDIAGRCLWTLLIGYLGGLAGRYFYARRTQSGTP